MAGMASTVERRTDTLTDTHKGRNEREGDTRAQTEGGKEQRAWLHLTTGWGWIPYIEREADWQAGRQAGRLAEAKVKASERGVTQARRPDDDDARLPGSGRGPGREVR